MISCMDTMVKIWESFAQVFSTDVRNRNISIEILALLPCAKTMAHGKGANLCRMQKPWHMAKIWTLSCGRLQGTRQIFGHVIVPGWLLYFAVGREWHTANPLPCARYIAHGKGRLCRSLVAVCALPCAAHGKRFAVGFWGFTVCPWHTAKGRSPVVTSWWAKPQPWPYFTKSELRSPS